MRFHWDLDIGFWDFIGIWDLDILPQSLRFSILKHETHTPPGFAVGQDGI
jgi:hypothetical protein